MDGPERLSLRMLRPPHNTTEDAVCCGSGSDLPAPLNKHADTASGISFTSPGSAGAARTKTPPPSPERAALITWKTELWGLGSRRLTELLPCSGGIRRGWRGDNELRKQTVGGGDERSRSFLKE